MNFRNNPRLSYYLLAVLGAGAVVASSFFWTGFVGYGFVLYFFDVGQGDAILARSFDGVDLLVDGGRGREILEKLGSVLPLWDNKIELVVLTHPDRDHIGGIKAVLERYDIGAVLLTGVEREDLPAYKDIFTLTQARRIPLVFVRSGTAVSLGKEAMLRVLAPQQDFRSRSVSDTNDTSIVSILSVGKVDVLLTGDAERKEEQELMPLLSKASEIEILKVGHHGSRSSSSEDFLNAVHANLAVISVGKQNSYGHPHPEVLSRLEKVGAKILRTDLEGDIVFAIDGQKLFRTRPRYKNLAFLYPLFTQKEFVLEGQ